MVVTTVTKKRWSTMIRQYIAVVCVVALTVGLTACSKNILPETTDDVDAVFEQDYDLIDEVTSHLLALEESGVWIQCREKEISGEFGKPMEFQSSKIEQIVEELRNKGYYHISKRENVVIFDVWRKAFDVEFEAGFVYSIDGSGDLSDVEYLTYQRPLSKENWYYYESDFNEWRVRQDMQKDAAS